MSGFYELLQKTNHLKATDPRDRIWALLALIEVDVSYGSENSNATAVAGIRINYTLPIAGVFADVTKLLLRNLLGRLGLLVQIDPNLPSWCIDFSSSELPVLYDEDDMQTKRYDYRMPWWAPRLPCISQQQGDWHELRIAGWHVATVTLFK